VGRLRWGQFAMLKIRIKQADQQARASVATRLGLGDEAPHNVGCQVSEPL